jgi:hypothetical protein
VVVTVNGRQVVKFTGDRPKGGRYVGVLATSSPGKVGDIWSITGFKVAEPQASSQATGDYGDGTVPPPSQSRRKR